MNEVVVACHSGYSYAGRPKEFYWDRDRFEVESIQAEWQGPDRKHFLINAKDGKIFELIYDKAMDRWEIQPK